MRFNFQKWDNFVRAGDAIACIIGARAGAAAGEDQGCGSPKSRRSDQTG